MPRLDRPLQADFIGKMKIGEVKEWSWAESVTNCKSVQKDLLRVARGKGWTITTKVVETGKKRVPYLVKVKLLAKTDIKDF